MPGYSLSYIIFQGLPLVLSAAIGSGLILLAYSLAI